MEATHLAQVGAIPMRGSPGSVQVLMITSRESRRWIIPKGWPMKGKKDYAAAAQEAFEEAGVTGKVHRHPVGAYSYLKRFGDNEQPIRVMVYLLVVDHKKRAWPEKDQREREWMSPEQASTLVEEPGLANILRRVDADTIAALG